MDVNAVAATVAKLPPPPLPPIDTAGGAFADFLQATGTTSVPTASSAANLAPTQNPPVSQQSASTPQQSSASQSDSAAANTAAQTAQASPPSDNGGSAVTEQHDSATGEQGDTAANSNGADAGDDKAADKDKSSNTAKGDDTAAQNAAAALLALLTAATPQTPTAGAVGLPSAGKATAASDAAAGTAKAASILVAAAASTQSALAGQGAQSGTDSQTDGALQLTGFKAAAAEHGLTTLLNGSSGSPQTDLLNAADAQVAVSGNSTAGPPQSLLTGALLAAASAIGENGGAELLSSIEATGAEVAQKPSDGQPAVPIADAPAPTANPIVDAQTGQLQPGGAAFVTTANTSVTGIQPSTNSQSAGQQILLNAPAEQIAVHMAKAAANDVNRINIQLDPADLGRVEVKMEVGHDGHVLATIAADRPQTLDMLQRDSASLQRALQDAGLNTDGQSLSFSLRQQGNQASGDGGQGAGNGGGRSSNNGTPTSAAVQPMTNRADDIGLDIRV